MHWFSPKIWLKDTENNINLKKTMEKNMSIKHIDSFFLDYINFFFIIDFFHGNSKGNHNIYISPHILITIYLSIHYIYLYINIYIIKWWIGTDKVSIWWDEKNKSSSKIFSFHFQFFLSFKKRCRFLYFPQII